MKHNAAYMMACLLALFLSNIIACTESELPGKGVGEGGPVIYPKGWPLPAVKVPDGSTRARFPGPGYGSNNYYDGYIVQGREAELGMEYAVCFRYDGEWSDLTSHFTSYIPDLRVVQEYVEGEVKSFVMKDDRGHTLILGLTAKGGVYGLTIVTSELEP